MTMINERVAGKDISLGKSTLRKSPKRTSRFLESKKEGCFSKPCARSFLNSQSDYTFDNFCEKSCCFLEAGIVLLSLPPDFTWMGPAACERCARLQLVDLSRTEISEIMGSTFALLAFATAQSFQQTTKDWTRSFSEMHFAARGAHPANFAVYCSTSFCGLHATLHIPQTGKRTTWRGPYAEANAFDKCGHFDIPKWIHLLPPNTNSGCDMWADDFCEELRKDLH